MSKKILRISLICFLIALPVFAASYERYIRMYNVQGITFSNALNFPKAQKIQEYFNKVGFGIGTNLTCDTGLQGYKPANIVMKLSKCRLSDKDPWEKCIKISDDLGKHMGDTEEFEIAKKELHL